ncbi:MAG TPA: cytochrome c oxidase subunit I [Verrucomicrobiae bacterium]|nr:cytochrome c oxidase subunit I [Verrucomicrobiae bacterium]
MNAPQPQALPWPAPAASSESSRLFSWVTTVDHKRIGILYLGTVAMFFLVGGVEALLLRVQLAIPRNTFLSPGAFNQIFTMHGTTMIFLVVMPGLVGFANYLVPLMIGARDMAFPRLNALSYWMFLFGGILLNISFAAGGAPAVGWFSYAPLSETPFSSTTGVDYWVLSLLILGTGSIAASINLIATILTLRAPGLTMRKLPLFVWMNFVNSFLILLALPALNAAIIMLLIDRLLQTSFFMAAHGGSPLLWQHFFWTFGHPEVYIMALPAFGMISEVIPVFSRKPIFGYAFVAASTVAIAVLSFGVWAHHMFTVGLGHTADLFFAAASLAIAVPTGVKIFNWVATLWGGSLRLTTPMLFAIAFLLQFTIGGLSGVTFATVPLDWQLTDTYYVVAHFHYVLFGGTFFAIMAATYYWFPKMSGRMLSERIGKWNFWMAVVGFNLTFFVQHFLGFMGMPRRVYTYPNLPYWTSLNMASTVGAFILGASALVLLGNIAISLRRGAPAGDNPWQAWTLEWATSSPPPEHNFERVPPIRSRRPLWDLAHPERPDPPLDIEVAPQNTGVAATTLLPGSQPGPAPLNASRPGAEQIPIPLRRPSSTGHPLLEKNFVAISSFILSEGFFFVMLIAAFIYFGMSLHFGPIAAASLARFKAAVYSVFLFSSSFTVWRAEISLRKNRHTAFRAWWGATILLGLVFLAGQAREYLHLFREGVTPNSSLFATTFFTLTGFHGLHVSIGIIALLIVLGLAFAGDFRSGRTEAVRTIGLYWHFVDVVWVFVFTAIYLAGPHL